MPHSAFAGQTPDEMFFGTGNAVVVDLMTAEECSRAAESRQIELQGALCASGRRNRGRCYCDGRGSECHETQLACILAKVGDSEHIRE